MRGGGGRGGGRSVLGSGASMGLKFRVDVLGFRVSG